LNEIPGRPRTPHGDALQPPEGRARLPVEPLTVGLAGLGYWGPNLARNLDELPGLELAWLCDSDEERLESYAARFPDAHRTTRFDDLLEDQGLGAVAIATPVVTHFDLTRQALLAGKNVFVEKPLALSSALGEQLVALAEERGLVLMPGHLLLYHPGVAKLKELVAAGDLGRLLYVYGNRQNLGQIRRDENALWSLGAHDLSVILHLVDEEPIEAWARGESFLNPGVEDVVFCYLRFPSGVVAHMHLSWLDPHKMRRMTVVGDRKMAVFDDMELERKMTVYDKGPEQRADTWGEWQTRTGDISIPKVANEEPLRLECEHFLHLLRGEDDRFAAARDGLAVVRALEQLQASLERERV
jgi:predicted dehydrogenase